MSSSTAIINKNQGQGLTGPCLPAKPWPLVTNQVLLAMKSRCFLASSWHECQLLIGNLFIAHTNFNRKRLATSWLALNVSQKISKRADFHEWRALNLNSACTYHSQDFSHPGLFGICLSLVKTYVPQTCLFLPQTFCSVFINATPHCIPLSAEL